jgi:hypothetical protein
MRGTWGHSQYCRAGLIYPPKGEFQGGRYPYIKLHGSLESGLDVNKMALRQALEFTQATAV